MTVKVFGLCVVLLCLLNCYVYGLSVLKETVYETTTKYEEPTTSGSLKETERKEKLYLISEDKLPWYEARFSCLIKGLRLASPLNPYENEKLLEYIRKNELIPADKFAGYWIGGFRTRGEEPWLWESTKTQSDDFGWLPGEPNYYPGEDCMELKNDRGTLGWNNYYCPEKKRYICEKLVNSDSAEDDKADIKENEGGQRTAAKEKPLKDDEEKSEILIAQDGGFPDDDLVSGNEKEYPKKEEEESSTDQEPEDETSAEPIKDIEELGEENEDFLTLTYNKELDKENEINHGLFRK